MKKIISVKPAQKQISGVREIIGKNIDTAIRELGITQAKFANKIGIKPGTLSYWVNGKRIETLSSLEKISKVTGKPVEWFLQESHEDSGLYKTVIELQQQVADIKSKYGK
ncbi:hypothetical protein CCP3SC15_210025 [Gammaproteobacteria bacterium]